APLPSLPRVGQNGTTFQDSAMSHCQSSMVRLCAKRADQFGIDWSLAALEHGVSNIDDAAPEQRFPWPFFSALLEQLEARLGGPLGIEQMGAEIAAAHPLFRLLMHLHFGLLEIQEVAAERLLPYLFDGVVQTLVHRQPEGALRITLSLGKEHSTCYAFWSLLLGYFRPVSRLFGLADCIVDVEMADRFAEFIVVCPQELPGEPTEGQEIRRRVREVLLKDLVRFEALRELPNPDLRSSVFERRVGAAAKPGEPPASGIDAFIADIRCKLGVELVQLFEMTPVGLRRLGLPREGIHGARIRRALWLGGAVVGAIEIERPSSVGHAREASLLDEYIDGFAYRLAELQNRLPYGTGAGGFALAESKVSDPALGEAPPSSRGRVSRAARDGRLNELTELWQLSERQRSVLALLVDGLGNREIAARLGCTIGTIENHVTRLLKRAQVDNRAALTAVFWKTQRR
ncbi:MAG TPA: LuxR C-terminal-related transcriptional regulator, partial [Polyangiaceae bacterium]